MGGTIGSNPFLDAFRFQTAGVDRPIEGATFAIPPDAADRLKINGQPVKGRTGAVVRRDASVYLTPFVLESGKQIGDVQRALDQLNDGHDHLLLEVVDPATRKTTPGGNGTVESFYLIVSADRLRLPDAPSPYGSSAYMQLEVNGRSLAASLVSSKKRDEGESVLHSPAYTVAAGISELFGGNAAAGVKFMGSGWGMSSSDLSNTTQALTEASKPPSFAAMDKLINPVARPPLSPAPPPPKRIGK
jgi:hypothetical protein